jgi:hypothetical protein
MQDFLLWWSILSTVVALALLGWDIWQLSASGKEKELSEKEKEIHKAQVKLWQHHASGIMHGLINLSQEAFSTIKDSQNAAKTLLPSAHSLYSSLNEERLFTEQEIKEKQLRQEEESKKLQSAIQAANEAAQKG